MRLADNDLTAVALRLFRNSLRGILICSAAGLIAGCAVSPYDQKTDDSLTQIQKDVDDYLAELNTNGVPASQPGPATQPAPATQPVKPPFYAKIDGEFHSLLIRTEAREGADPSVKSEYQSILEFQQAVDGIWNIESASPGRPPGGLVEITQTAVDSAAKAVLALELQRKSK
jgi:hypothetical protein